MVSYSPGPSSSKLCSLVGVSESNQAVKPFSIHSGATVVTSVVEGLMVVVDTVVGGVDSDGVLSSVGVVVTTGNDI